MFDVSKSSPGYHMVTNFRHRIIQLNIHEILIISCMNSKVYMK